MGKAKRLTEEELFAQQDKARADFLEALGPTVRKDFEDEFGTVVYFEQVEPATIHSAREWRVRTADYSVDLRIGIGYHVDDRPWVDDWRKL